MNVLMKFSFFVWLILAIPALAASANKDSKEQTQEELYQQFLSTPYIKTNLQFSLALINLELEELKKKPYKLKSKYLKPLRQQLLVRYHPEEIKNQLLQNLMASHTEKQSGIEALLQIFESELSLELHTLRQTALKTELKPEVIAYHKKLDESPAQNHRQQIARAFDGLQRISAMQTQLHMQIKKSVKGGLPKKKQKYYKLESESDLTDVYMKHNQDINLFAFRERPASDFVSHLDALAESDNQKTFDSLLEAYKITLKERSELKFTIEP
jgi:hypothetical protein